jgi:hypothetical protein
MLSSCSILMDERLQKNSALRRHSECRPEWGIQGRGV